MQAVAQVHPKNSEKTPSPQTCTHTLKKIQRTKDWHKRMEKLFAQQSY